MDEASRVITCYEGGPLTAFDAQIIEQENLYGPFTSHVCLTDDQDQITSRWKAGDYRRVTKRLAVHAASNEAVLEVDPRLLKKLGRQQIAVPQPTLVALSRPCKEPDCHVFDDLVLPATLDDTSKWKLVSLLETPVVRIGGQYRALSGDLRAVSRTDDYMLRLAARLDPKQYGDVNGKRHERMIDICLRTLRSCTRPWCAKERVHLKDPSQEADILAERASERLLLELKSTLRPETPWESYKRNEDIICGVKKTREKLDRRVAERGFVVTDGYRGDYACWAEALKYSVPIATLYEIEAIADDPSAAERDVKRRMGITSQDEASHAQLPDSEVDLAGWRLRVVDGAAPAETAR